MKTKNGATDFPRLETDRLILRHLTLDDAEFILRHWGDPVVARYLFDEDPVADLDQARELIEPYLDPAGKSYNRWGILLKAQDALIGTCGFHKWNRQHFRAEMGYDLAPAYWGRGLMTEAAQEMIRHGFQGLGLNRIDALVYPDNNRSIRLLAKLGFQEEGLLREYFCQAGRFHDHLVLSLLRSEWTPAV
jgi:ribosomal-protein-alanine N-acetyltransferase